MKYLAVLVLLLCTSFVSAQHRGGFSLRQYPQRLYTNTQRMQQYQYRFNYQYQRPYYQPYYYSQPQFNNYYYQSNSSCSNGNCNR